MKKTTAISTYIILALLLATGCHKNPNNPCRNDVTSMTLNTMMLPADGKSLATVTKINILSSDSSNIGDSTDIILTITDGTILFNNSAPTSRLTLSFVQIKNINLNLYSLQVRSGNNPDNNVRLMIESQCGIVWQQI